MIRPSILESFCSKSQIWIRDFWIEQEKQENITNHTTCHNISHNQNRKIRKTKQTIIKTYTLKKPKDEVLLQRPQNPNSP